MNKIMIMEIEKVKARSNGIVIIILSDIFSVITFFRGWCIVFLFYASTNMKIVIIFSKRPST